MAAFLDRVRAVIRNEWLRVRGGSPLDPNLEMSLLNDLLNAFSMGKVIPGYYPNAQGACEMHWDELACFGRWYSLLNEEQRMEALDNFTYGVAAPWLEPGEYAWPPSPARCTDASAEQEAAWCAQYAENGVCKSQWCCPPEVYGDPVYAGAKESSKGSTKLIALGVGALTAAAIAAWLISSSAEPRYVVASK
jgi:hypothetical protein